MTLSRNITAALAAACLFFSTGFSRAGSWLESLFPSAAAASTSPRSSNQFPSYTLRAEKTWQLNFPRGKQFDASGLVKTPQGELWTVNDRGASIYRIDFSGDEPSAKLVVLPDYFTPAQLAGFRGEKRDRYDGEGIALDERGRLYLCEEANRWILRYDPAAKVVERLEIDWSPVKKYFSRIDSNASFEGVAVGGGFLYVANERQVGRILVVDQQTLKVVRDFSPQPADTFARDIHYSDICWFRGSLYVLLRNSRCVLQVDPASERVLAQFNFGEMERAPDVQYVTLYPTGTMEGLAVDDTHIWLVTDNNGLGRVRNTDDARPTLFKCKRPDVKP